MQTQKRAVLILIKQNEAPKLSASHSCQLRSNQDPFLHGGCSYPCKIEAALMIKRTYSSIYFLLVASLASGGALAWTPDCALAAEIPKDFQGRWCTISKSLKDGWGASSTEGADCEGDYSLIEITATDVKIPALSVSCVIRKITKFDVCPWGMIFRDRQRARIRRPFQINPWSPGFHIVLQCTSGPQQPETIENDWVIEKGSIRVSMPRDYRCPWDRKVSR